MADKNDLKSIARRLRKSMTRQEIAPWRRLREMKALGLTFRRQAAIAGYIVDFINYELRIVIEIDGSQHGFDSHVRRDAERDAQLALNGFAVLRFWNHEIDRNIEAVIETIYRRGLERDPTHPSLKRLAALDGTG